MPIKIKCLYCLRKFMILESILHVKRLDIVLLLLFCWLLVFLSFFVYLLTFRTKVKFNIAKDKLSKKGKFMSVLRYLVTRVWYSQRLIITSDLMCTCTDNMTDVNFNRCINASAPE